MAEISKERFAMPIQLQAENDGRSLLVHVSGKLTKEDYGPFTPEVDRLVERHGKVRVLFDLTGFHGWEPAGLWEDLKFDAKHASHIERMAVVGETRWHHGMAVACRPFTKAPVRYFDHAETAEARKWLEAA